MDGAEASAGVTKAQENRPLFERFGDADVRALIEGFPLAWVCGGGAGAVEASLLPLIGV